MYRKDKIFFYFLPIVLIFLINFIISSCDLFGSSSSSSRGGGGSGGSGGSDETGEDFSDVVLSSAWTAYNDCVDNDGNHENATYFNLQNPDGILKKISDGSDSGITVEMEAENVSSWDPTGTPQAGTDAYNTFNGFLNIDEVASYGNENNPWYYQVTFSNLDPAKKYAFVTTANRNFDYVADGRQPRWTKFTISGADTFSNISSSGVSRVSAGVVKINTGYNTVNGYVAAWTGITASDGTFTVRSENVGAEGPGESFMSYGLQGFKLMELSE
ncbi:MAG: hypothetical protein RBT69_01565 [Spirochaetia bacterium]|jgi:hypothetical protein|nr:hypothetical protein [Spirochaetia bacterium]